MTRRAARPVLNTDRLFETEDHWGIPALPLVPRHLAPARLVPYRTRWHVQPVPADTGVHFFLDDYRFEVVWNQPRKALPSLAPYRAVLTPDFSLYRNWPLALQLWNTYRSRWCGAFWHSHGFTVIPTVSWGGAASYDFCFLGIPRHSLVAVGTVGVRLSDPAEGELFMAGFREMLRQLDPSGVLCYGQVPAPAETLVEIIRYPTRWEQVRQGLQEVEETNGRTRHESLA